MSAGRALLLVSFGLVGFSFLLPGSPAAAWPEDPALNVALCDTINDQTDPVGVTDGAGGAIVAWTDFRTAFVADIYVQRIAANGQVLWRRNGQPLCTASGGQRYAAIASDGAGGAIVAWEDERSTGDIYVQRVSAAGEVQWTANGVGVCTAAGMQQLAAIVADGAGGAVVAWQDARAGSGNEDIYAQRISAAGAVQWAADGVALCTATESQRAPIIATDGAGGAIVVWLDYRNGAANLYAQRISAAGAVQWTADGVALCLAGEDQIEPAMVADGAGGAVVVWTDSRTNYPDIYAQRVSAAGSVQWEANGVALCLETGTQQRPALASDGAGGAYVAWQDWRGAYYDIYAQHVAATGTVYWTEGGKAFCTASGGQGVARVIPDGTGGAIIGWEDYRGASMDIYAQRVTADGTALWDVDGVPICFADGNQWTFTMVPDGESGALLAWQDYRNVAADIYTQRVWADGTTPVLVSLVEAEVVGGRVELTWFTGAGASVTAAVYRATPGVDWAPVGTVSTDGTGHLRYSDPVDRTAGRVGYRLGIVDDGVESFFGETWLDLPRTGFALAGASPNPASDGALTVRFGLPSAAPARLELVDVNGRRIVSRDVGSLGAGPHAVELDAGRLAPGLYLLRLRQGADERVARVAVVK